MNTRAPIRLTACLLLLLHGLSFPTPSLAEETAKTIKLDGKSFYIPEVKLTRKINPVTSFLFIGAWEGNAKSGSNQTPLCAIDPETNSVQIKYPDKLLDNSKTWVATRDGVGAFLDSMTWGSRQATHFAFKVVSKKRQPAIIELYTDSLAAAYNNGKMASKVTTAGATGAGGRGYLPVMLEAGGNIINIKQFTTGQPRIQAFVCLDHAADLPAAWQTHGGLLKNPFFTELCG